LLVNLEGSFCLKNGDSASGFISPLKLTKLQISISSKKLQALAYPLYGLTAQKRYEF